MSTPLVRTNRLSAPLLLGKFIFIFILWKESDGVSGSALLLSFISYFFLCFIEVDLD